VARERKLTSTQRNKSARRAGIVRIAIGASLLSRKQR
jgi:hypothetical protein